MNICYTQVSPASLLSVKYPVIFHKVIVLKLVNLKVYSILCKPTIQDCTTLLIYIAGINLLLFVALCTYVFSIQVKLLKYEK